MLEKRTEQCAYIKLNRKPESCGGCDGYSGYCFQYVTVEHLEKFKEMFEPQSSIILRVYATYIGERIVWM